MVGGVDGRGKAGSSSSATKYRYNLLITDIFEHVGFAMEMVPIKVVINQRLQLEKKP